MRARELIGRSHRVTEILPFRQRHTRKRSGAICTGAWRTHDHGHTHEDRGRRRHRKGRAAHRRLLESRGHDVVVDLAREWRGCDHPRRSCRGARGRRTIIDATTGPSPEQQAATEFFTTATRNLQEAGERAGVSRWWSSRSSASTASPPATAAKLAHEHAALAGPIPARILRAAQFHEFVAQMIAWGTQGDVIYVPEMRTQLVAASTVAQALADLATDGWPASATGADPRDRRPARGESGRHGETARRRGAAKTPIQGVSNPADPDGRSTSRARCFRGRTPPLPGRRSRSGSASGSERVTSRAAIRQADACASGRPPLSVSRRRRRAGCRSGGSARAGTARRTRTAHRARSRRA